MRKSIYSVLLAAVLTAVLSLSCFALYIPEESDPIGKSFNIEKDENVILENLREDKEEQDDGDRQVNMTRENYITLAVKPGLLIILCGVAVLVLTKVFDLVRKASMKRKLAANLQVTEETAANDAEETCSAAENSVGECAADETAAEKDVAEEEKAAEEEKSSETSENSDSHPESEN